MSFSYWWFSCFLSDSDHQRLLPLVSEAERKTVLQPETETVLAFWRSHPERFEESWMLSVYRDIRRQQSIWYDKFIATFNLPGYIEFGEAIVSEEFLSKETCFRFIITRRCPPVAVLWHALKYERAVLLPGTMGNLFLSADQIADALTQTNYALRDLNLNEAIERGMRFAGHSNNTENISEIITHLPQGLLHALEIGMGFMAVARPQI